MNRVGTALRAFAHPTLAVFNRAARSPRFVLRTRLLMPLVRNLRKVQRSSDCCNG
jgi:hypothetical protein